jgi:hypothetical protein
MKRVAFVVVGSLLALFVMAAAEAPKTLHFPLYQYSIDPLEAPSTAANTTLLMMFLPASDGFAPNVNVIAQNSPLSIAEYIATTTRETEQQHLKMIKADKVSDTIAVFEYAGKLQDKDLHWYSKATRTGGKILLATATAHETQWPNVSAKLQACVDSFQADGAK